MTFGHMMRSVTSRDRVDKSAKCNQPAALRQAGKLQPPLVQRLGGSSKTAEALIATDETSVAGERGSLEAA